LVPSFFVSVIGISRPWGTVRVKYLIVCGLVFGEEVFGSDGQSFELCGEGR
jgi:hypothetical protein